MILLWGLAADAPLGRVYRALRRAGAAVRLLDQRRLLTATAELTVGDQLTATVRCDGRELDLNRCTAAYIRPFDATQLAWVKRAGPDDPLWTRAAELDQLLLSWTELTDALVVNRPSAMASNDSKPLQAAELRACGFAVPETLVTTDPDAARAFLECHRQVIYKSISSVRSIVAELSGAALARLDTVRWCPTQFQERVAGTDYRVHVVGDQVFATRVQSDAVDYRYAGGESGPAVLHAAEIPDDIADRCVAVSARLGMAFTGIDLRLTPDGRWYCFEVNPSPGFTYYQQATGQPIDAAVARLLIGGTAPPRRETRWETWSAPEPRCSAPWAPRLRPSPPAVSR